MTPDDQTRAFCNDLDALITRYAREFDLTYATIIGCMTLRTKMLCDEAAEDGCGGDGCGGDGMEDNDE